MRQPGSFDPRAAFIFAGIGPDEAIGDFPSLMVQHGAAGYEMDRLDFSLGTPPHALLLASSVGHSDRYNAFIDERLQFTKGIDGVLSTTPPQEGVIHPFIQRRYGLLRDDERRWGLLRRVYRLARQPLVQRLRQQRLAHHRERPAPLRRGGAGLMVPVEDGSGD